MSCDEIKPLLNARLDDEIDPVKRADFDAHVKTCSSCAEDLEGLESVRHSIRGRLNKKTFYRSSLRCLGVRVTHSAACRHRQPA